MAVPVRGLHAREETAARLLRAAAALAGPGDRLGQPRRQERCARRGPWVCRRSAAARPPLWSGARSGIRAAAAVSPPEGAGVKRPKPRLPDDVEEYRDARWCREGTRQIETAADAEQFIEQVGFTACLTDSRRPGPSLYVAVCGRRDAVLPRNVQKDPEASLTWVLKDEIVGRGKMYYAKLARGKATFLAPRMVPCFHAIWGVRKADEKRRLSKPAQSILKVLRKEWEMSTSDLRDESGVKDRQKFTRAMDELQAAMIVVPSEVCYVPKFTYIWTIGVGRFPDALRRRLSRETALREIARC